MLGSPIRKSADITDICSSPQLIAACHVLLRLLMPRHSPCALSSLTSSGQTALTSFPPFGANFVSLRCPSSSSHKRFAGLCSDLDGGSALRAVRPFFSHKRFLVLLRIMQAIQRKFSFTKSLPFTFRCCSTIKTKTFCCLAFAFFSLFSFQGAVSGLF